MNVFVTGGTGFVGAHLVRTLVERGDRVTCLVRDPAKPVALGWRDVGIVRGDLDDPGALRAGCADAEVVYHLAGRISARNLVEFMRANRDGTANLLEAAAGGDAASSRRLVLVSSLAAAGPTTPGHPIDETHRPQPVTDYGRSKLAAELLTRAAPIPWTIVRPPIVYGEWDREVLKIFRLARLGIGTVVGDGSQELSLIYAGDLAEALIAAGTAPGAAGRVYYAAHPDPISSRALARAVGRAVDRTVRLVPLPGPLAHAVLWIIGTLANFAGRATILSADKANEFLAPAWTCRSDALMRDTGWRARTDLEPGLRRTADWYRQQGWL
ncbi:MAG: NAD-dependent epimerase/dehydratase family protein [Gemmatimonadales bacterium]